MKIKIIKKDNEIAAKIINEDNSEKDFSNLEMINFLYKNDNDIDFIFDDSIKEEEKNKINEFYKSIKLKVCESKKAK